MSQYALEFEGVFKKFHKGEDYDSLRDLIPAMTRGIFSRNHTDELRKREFWALKDVSFRVCKGETLGIIGRNGSGKSTTLKLLSGVLAPTTGRISIGGRIGALIEVGAGFHPDLTGRENIYLNGAILGMTRKEIERRFDDIVEFSELKEFLDTPVKRYSSGMYARLGFAIAAYLQCDVLLIDEVLSVGDNTFQIKCVEKIKALQRAGAAVVFVSHNMAAVQEVCKRVIWLDHGAIHAEGPAARVIDAYRNPPQVSHMRETGTGLTIRHVGFLNALEEETHHFNLGDKMFLRIKIRASKTFSSPTVGIAFHNENGICVYGHNTRLDRTDLGDMSGDCQLDVEYPNLWLQPGNYLVSVLIHDSAALTPYDVKEKHYGFTVGGTTGELGVTYIPHHWKDPIIDCDMNSPVDIKRGLF